MWKSRVYNSLYRLNRASNKIGIGKLSFVDYLKRRGRELVERSLTLDGALQIKIGGMPFYIYPDTADFHAYFDRPFEPYTVELFKRAVKQGARVLDIGAQFGYFSLVAAKQAGHGGEVYAFEPAPANFKLLKRNIALNGYANCIYPIPKAVAEKRKTVPFFVYEDSDSHAMYRHPEARVKEEVYVECVTIDEALGGQAVDVIKMDIEGNEPYALEGMRKTISNSGGLTLIAELAPAYLRRAGFEPKEYLAKLESLGFSVRAIDDRSLALRPVGPELLWEAEQDPSWYANLYCTKSSG
jgi:FkbM family methyltransferase